MKRWFPFVLAALLSLGSLSGCRISNPVATPVPEATVGSAVEPVPSVTMPPMPRILSQSEALALVDPIVLGQAPMLKMVEEITNRTVVQGFLPGSSNYNGQLQGSEPVYWNWGLGYNRSAAPGFDPAGLQAACRTIQVAFFLNGYALPPEGVLVYDTDNPIAFGRNYIVILSDWPSGEHRLQLVVVVTQPVEVNGELWQPGTMMVEDDIQVP